MIVLSTIAEPGDQKYICQLNSHYTWCAYKCSSTEVLWVFKHQEEI